MHLAITVSAARLFALATCLPCSPVPLAPWSVLSTFTFSPALVPRPPDWGRHVCVSGPLLLQLQLAEARQAAAASDGEAGSSSRSDSSQGAGAGGGSGWQHRLLLQRLLLLLLLFVAFLAVRVT